MKAGAVMADGPFRFVRNPLYIGLWFVFAALALLMPVSGALFAMAAVTVFLLRLILGEEAFLSGQLGQPYQDYLRAVPRLIPAFATPRPPPAASRAGYRLCSRRPPPSASSPRWPSSPGATTTGSWAK